MRKTLLVSAMIAFMAQGGAALAHDSNRHSPSSLTVSFRQCAEFAGLAPVAFDKARAAVPSQYQVAAAPAGQATLVVRAVKCQGIGINGKAPRPGIVAHYGISLVSPDGTGDINNYTLGFETDSPELALRLGLSGVNAALNPFLVAEYTASADPLAGTLFVQVPPPARQPFYLAGPVNQPDLTQPGFPFIANWWRAAGQSSIKMSTNIPEIRFGHSPALTAYVRPSSSLGRLIGGISTQFPFLSVRGIFDNAEMTVTAQ